MQESVQLYKFKEALKLLWLPPEPPGTPAPGGGDGALCRLGFRTRQKPERLMLNLGEQGLQLSPAQKQEVFQVLVRKLRSTSSSNWLRRPGQLVRQGAAPFSLDLAALGQPVFRGTPPPGAGR